MAKDGTIKINAELDSAKAQAAMSKFSSLSKGALKGVTVAIGAVGTAMAVMAGYSIKVGSDFEAGMSKVSAISGATGADLESLSDKAKEMGAKTKFSATEAASAFEYMAMAGWKTGDMLDGIEGVMNLAAASGEDLASVSDIVTDAITAFGLSASDSAHFADVLAKAASSSNTNVGMMGATFKYAAPLAGALKYSIEDTATAIGLMANAGIKGEHAGTSLRAMLTRLVDPPADAAKALEALGVSITNSDGTMKPLLETIKDLRGGFANLDDSQKASYASSIAGQEAMSGLLAIVGASDEDFNSLVASINNADGAAEEMAETMQDNLQGSITILLSSLEGFGIKVYEEIQDPLKEAADIGIDCVNRLSSAFDSGGLHGVVEETGEIFNDLADRIADTSDVAKDIITPLKKIAGITAGAMKTGLKVFADGFKTIATHLDVAVPLLVAGATAIKGYSVAKTAATLIQKLAKAYTASAAALDLYITANGVAAVVTGASTGAVTLNQIAVGLLTKQLGLATAAQAAFNAIVNAQPVALAITAVAALTAGLVTYAIVTDEATQKTYGLSEADKKVLDASKELTDGLNEQRSARQDTIQSIDMEYDSYEALLSELQSITDENGRVKAGYEGRAEIITGQLAEALGVEISLVDGAIQINGEYVGSMEEVAAAIEKVIVQKKAEALCSALQEDMANAYKNSKDAMLAYKDAVAVSEEKQKDLQKAQANYNDVSDKYAGQTGPAAISALSKAEKSLGDAQKAFDDASESVDKTRTSLNELSTEVNNYDALVSAMAEGNTAAIESAMNALLTGYQSYTAEMLAESQTAQEDMLTQAQDSVNVLSVLLSEGGASYQAFGTEAADAVAKSVSNFNNLPGGIAAAIERIGPESAGAMVSALAQADLDGKLSEEGKKYLESLITAFDGLDEKTQEVFANVVYGALEGLAGFEALADPAKEGADTFLNSLKEALEVHSPSQAVKAIFAQVWPGASEGLDSGKEELGTKGQGVIQSFLESLGGEGIISKAQELGANIMSFFGLGITSRTGNSQNAGKANADAANTGAGSVNPTGTGNTFGSRYASGVGSKSGEANSSGRSLGNNAQSGASSANGYTPGSDFGSGFVSGIGSWLGSAASAAVNLAMSAYNALRNALAEHSPSRKAKKSGKNFDLGLAVGIKDNKDCAVSAAEDLAETTLDALDMSEISEKMKDIDVPDVMSRVYAAVDDRKQAVAEKIVSEQEGKYALQKSQNEALGSIGIAYKKLEKATAEWLTADDIVKALAESGLKVELDGKKVGDIITPRIDRNLRQRKV